MGLSAAPPLLFVVLAPLLPESPRWLLKKGRREAALRSLRALKAPEAKEADLQKALEDFAEAPEAPGPAGAPAVVSAATVAPAVPRSASAARGAARHPPDAARQGDGQQTKCWRLRAVATGGRHAADVARRGAVSSEAARRVCCVGVGHGLH